MAQITGELIKSAVALNISQNITLETPYKIYKEKVVQGMSKPCFFVWTVDVTQEKLMFNNYERYYQMNIRFHEEEDSPKLYEKLCDIGNQLLECLATLDIPITVLNDGGHTRNQVKPVRGSQMSFTITDNVLQVFATYKIKIKKQSEPVDEMNEMDIIYNIEY